MIKRYEGKYNSIKDTLDWLNLFYSLYLKQELLNGEEVVL